MCPLSHFKATVTLTTHRPIPARLQSLSSSKPVAMVLKGNVSNLNLVTNVLIRHEYMTIPYQIYSSLAFRSTESSLCIWNTAYPPDNKTLNLLVHWCLSQAWLLPLCPPGRELNKVHSVLMPENTHIQWFLYSVKMKKVQQMYTVYLAWTAKQCETGI